MVGTTTVVPEAGASRANASDRGTARSSANEGKNWGKSSDFRYVGVVRVVALFVVLCGCRVGAGTNNEDATTPRGDGLPERVTTDAALWADVRSADSAGADRADSDGTGAGDAAATDGGDAAAAPCRLLEPSCPVRQACYPYPFEGPPSGETRCRPEGMNRAPIQCQSQLECDGDNVCITPGQPDAVCLQRCSLDGPDCPPGTACLPVPGYPGVGACTI